MPVKWTRPAALAIVTLALTSALAQAGEPKWKKHTINPKSEFEAAGVFDVDLDGKLDIVSGSTWYQGPDWTPYPVREVSRTGTYLNCFATLPVDVNNDGKMDFVTCAYFTRNVGWVENPGDKNKNWTYHEIDLPGTSEAAQFVDLTGDGKPEVLPNCTNEVVFYQLEARGPNPKWKKFDFGKEAAGHGVGSGDVNGDGLVDLLTPKGWFEHPADTSTTTTTTNTTNDSVTTTTAISHNTERWPWHPDWQIGATGIQILARDIDGDGLSDVVYGMGHNYGLYWLKQVKSSDGSRAWIKKTIDETLSTVHTLIWADLDGDGTEELVTGKRVYAHEKEPGDTDASVIAWYAYDRDSKSWQKHIIYQGKPAKDAPTDPAKRLALTDFEPGTAGTGLQLTAIDIDGDGDTDLVCPGKSGLYLFENLGTSP